MENSPDHSNIAKIVLKIICGIFIFLLNIGFFGCLGTFILKKYNESDKDDLFYCGILVFLVIIAIITAIIIIYVIYDNRKIKEITLKYQAEIQKSNNEEKIYENILRTSPDLTEGLLKTKINNLENNKKQSDSTSNNNQDLMKMNEVLLIIKETLDKMFHDNK